MPKGPKGVRRPADTNAAAAMVGRHHLQERLVRDARLREAMAPSAKPGPMGGEGKVIEADETYLGKA